MITSQLHKDPAIAFAKKGYHLLLEKPMSNLEDECDEIAKVCEENGVMMTVCHVLRCPKIPNCHKTIFSYIFFQIFSSL